MSNYNVSLVGPAPWGFRLQGGKDFNMPLTISSLKDGGKASQAHVRIGDVVLSIDGISAQGMTHLEAQNKIKACTGSLNMTLQRASAAAKSEPVAVQKGEPKEVVKPVPITSPAVSKVTSTTNMAYNKVPRPFGSVSSPKVTSIPSPSSAFTPAHAATSSHASPPPVAAVTPPPLSASGLHASANPSAAQCSSPPNTGKPAVHVPRQPTVTSVCSESAQELAEGQRRGSQGDIKQQNGNPGTVKIPPKRPPRKHIVERNTEFYHIPTHSDASKKRLIEDTEDWRPRTGTTQSRSFRILAQITGTEHLKESENDNAKKANSTPEPSQQSASPLSAAESLESPGSNRPVVAGLRSAAAFKPVGSTSVKSPSWQRPNQAGTSMRKCGDVRSQHTQICFGSKAPSTGRISNSASSSGTGAPMKPAVGPPQPSDQDTLVQRAEHIPAGKRTPMCAHCNQAIRGPFLVALGKSWHPEEFNCAHCKNTMAYIGFVEEKGALYCELCYEKFFAPECGRCQRKILGEVINALKQTWHVSCFVCVACGKPIRNNVFHLEDGEPYCETDYYALFGTICRGCEFPIEAGDMFLEALGSTWHDTCFVCSVCCESLEGQTFFSKKDKPLCKKHAHSVNF
ncbi:PDZ and LIM domain protein 5 isoform X1 [Rattus norvegicus]|uniref:PDZ and LIM domain protein 5 isoform X1 n=1 Tax=Rattus norvegicus TaxID=10116 RepID=UPI0003D0B2C8|nr:PDZ and LIM domain protein 5 isoform X1 [Rattus norvegicus]|eukprot:XP_006233474.1 PREDICTED: PDZ and LIM domain protein 5 isoform X8 [Rattus norvegicus]